MTGSQQLSDLVRSGHWWLQRGLIRLQFGFLFPLAAWLGGRPARILVGLFGRVCFLLDCDWRTASLRQHFVRGRTHLAMVELHPDADSAHIDRLVRQRFICSAHEELDGHYFFSGASKESVCTFVGLPAIQAVLARRGIVFLTLHLDATLTGLVEMGKTGMKLNLMTSNIVEDERVLPVVRRYFRKKYDGIERWLNGGRTLHNETHLREFYRALTRGEGVVVLCEGPASRQEDGLIIDFLGKTRAVSSGAFRLASRTGAAVAGFVCVRTGDRQYEVHYSPVFEPSATSDTKENIVQVYRFLESAIRQYPGQWWAADLLPDYLNVEK